MLFQSSDLLVALLVPSHFDWMQIFMAYEKQLQYYAS